MAAPHFDFLEPRRYLAGATGGAPIFGPPTTIIPDSVPPISPPIVHTLAAGDFDGDGVPDLAVVSGSTISFLKGLGNGQFAPRISTMVSSPVGSIATGRFDDGGGLEIAAAADVTPVAHADDGTPPFWLGFKLRVFRFDQQSGGFRLRGRQMISAAHQGSFTGFIEMVVGDFSGSSADEFAVSMYILPWTNTPQSTLIQVFGFDHAGAPGISTIRTTLDRQNVRPFIAAADINGDGRPDLLFEPGSLWRAEISPPTHAGPLSRSIQRITLPGTSLVSQFADVNRDGIADAIGPSVALGRGDGTFGAPTSLILSYPSTPIEIAAADLNGDGRTDLLFTFFHAIPRGKGLWEWTIEEETRLQQADGSFAIGPLTTDGDYFSGSGGTQDTLLQDFNGDDRPDLLAYVNATVTLRLNVA
jgi:hypothetical protein